MAIETLDPLLKQTRGRGRGAYPIPLSTITTVGFLGRTERGPTDAPVLIESFSEYCRYFGGHLADGTVSHAVHDYFSHGGRRAIIVRVANRARRAQIEIPSEHDPLRLQARYPGRHEIMRVSIDYEQVEEDPFTFNLVVQRINAAGSRLVEDQELYPMVSTRPLDKRFIGEVLRDSRLIALAGPAPASRPLPTPPKRPGDPVRYIDMTVPGDDGEELTDYDIIGSNRDGTGLFAFGRGPHIDLLAIPLPPDQDLGSTAFVAASRFCEDRRTLLIWDPPCSWHSADEARLGFRRMNIADGNVLAYFPRIRPRGARYAAGMPACGAIAGMLAQRDRRGVFGRDEDVDYILRAALTPVLPLSQQEARRLLRCGVNTFVHSSGGTTRLVGRVMLGSFDLDLKRIGFFILNSIEEAVTAAAADNDLNASLVRSEWQLRRFFDDLYLRGTLKGRTPGQAFYLQKRGTNANGPLGLRFGIALSEPSHFAEYAVDLEGERAGRVRRFHGFQAEQLLH